MPKLPFLSLLALASLASAFGQAYNDFEEAPHQYWQGTPNDDATRLHERVTKGEVKLPTDSPRSFLSAYLKELGVPEGTQTLVFSRTSFQRGIIHAGNPRAIYFSNETYVGFIPGGRVEVMGTDPIRGGIFYIFDPPTADHPAPMLDRKRACLGCHAGSLTNFLPGLMVNSVYATREGRSLGDAPARFPGHMGSTQDRWGGWFVTGATPSLPHLGNLFSRREEGVVTSTSVAHLEQIFDPKEYVAGGSSEAAALLLLDHQIGALNRLMEANYRLRTALNKAREERPVEERAIPDEDMEMAKEQVERLVSYFLFQKEEPLSPDALKPDAAFAVAFRGTDGPSLRQLNLKTRLLEHRCSYMIDTATFRALPTAFRGMIWARLRTILKSPEAPEGYEYLPREERQAIAAILDATRPEWNEGG